MINLHAMRQTFDFDCGANALQAVMTYYGVDVREDMLIKELQADSEGVPVKNMISVAQSRGFTVDYGQHWTIEKVKQLVDEGHPVIVLLQAWADRYMRIDDWRRDYENGHYAIVIGHVGEMLIFEDPASFRRTWLKENEFLARWHDLDKRTNEKYENFGMILLGREPVRRTLEHMG
jgi:predicted double-glycine peptidase